MSQLVTVPFRGDTLFAVRDGETVRVALKPIADRLGLAWPAQLRRTKRDPILSEGMSLLDIPSPGGPQETATLPLDLLPGWLFGISAGAVKPEARDIVLTYQRECHGALFRHFYASAVAMGVHTADTLPAREETVSVRRGLVTEARHTFGAQAAGSLWLTLGLPIVPEMREGHRQGAFGFTYTAVPNAPARA